ncbi:TraX family protein, partial [Acinetobacter sp. ULE_I064]|uniref:TraX family protein n=1 Tax=Acinetobacter sp. ULE_I064 TaxID=3373071 RepID=UPI003AF9F12B
MRNKGLDVIKWIAIIAMVIDHLRFIDFISTLGYNNTLTIIGRFAFPMFCFVMAVNFKRIIENNNNDAIKSYLINLSIFSFISEIPYRLLEKTPHVLNVMPTLFLGMLLMVILVKNYNHKFLLIFDLFIFYFKFITFFIYFLILIIIKI